MRGTRRTLTERHFPCDAGGSEPARSGKVRTQTLEARGSHVALGSGADGTCARVFPVGMCSFLCKQLPWEYPELDYWSDMLGAVSQVWRVVH